MVLVIKWTSEASISIVKEIHQPINRVIRIKPTGKKTFFLLLKTRKMFLLTLNDDSHVARSYAEKENDVQSGR